MKNEHIQNLSVPVPRELRLQIYNTAKDLILSRERAFNLSQHDDKNSYPLCLILPCLLWGLEDFCDKGPAGRTWDFKETQIAFPELTDKCIDAIEGAENCNVERLARLEMYIKELTPVL